jgi:hypothetical protein
VRLIRVEPTLSLRVLPFGRGVGEEVAAHRRAGDAELTGDAQDGPTVGGQTLDLGMEFCGAPT